MGGHAVISGSRRRIKSQNYDVVIIGGGQRDRVDWRRLEAAGVDRFIGRGVFYGAGRTGAPTVAGKRVFIVGAGNSAGQAALFADYASSVTIDHPYSFQAGDLKLGSNIPF
ncbi:MAG: thioredoxin reductase, partial [Acidobacteriaceae bacterium]|nr:thioredoxin reductase [Acidobacteriaceae bacterium]